MEKSDEKPKWPYELFGIECGDGWKQLYQPIIDYIDEYNKTHNDKPIEIHQIKEKFGGLCFYTNFKTDELRSMIEDAEWKAYDAKVYNYALRMTEKEIHQAAEGLAHNLNTLQSRSGN